MSDINDHDLNILLHDKGESPSEESQGATPSEGGPLPFHISELQLPPNIDLAYAQDLMDKILWSFKFYPFLNHTMCQIAVGTNTPSSAWRPIVDALISKGILKMTSIYTISSSGRGISLNLISYACAKFDPSLWGAILPEGTSINHHN